MRQHFSISNGLPPDVFTFQKSGSTNNFTPGFNYGCCLTSRVSWKINNGLETVLIAGNFLSYSGFSADTNIRDVFIQGKKIENFATQIFFTNDNIYGHLDLSSIRINSNFTISNNPNLTGITHSTQPQVIQQYEASNCNLTGNLTIPSSGFYGEFDVSLNPNLTGITHDGNTLSLEPITKYHAYSCNLTGLLDLSTLTNLGGEFDVSLNPNLTGITYGPSTNNFSDYIVDSCNLTGDLDLTPLSGLGGTLFVSSNPYLTSITLPNTTNGFDTIVIDNNNLTGTLDLTPFTNFTAPSGLSFELNPSLTNIIFPISIGDFTNTGLSFQACDLDYVDMKPLSGASVYNSLIYFGNNNMTTSDVNHILVDFSGNATYNPTGWSNIILDISGTNGAPDSSSGGYDGLAAITFLTSPPYNWTITHT
jgi:hypothetical protein